MPVTDPEPHPVFPQPLYNPIDLVQPISLPYYNSQPVSYAQVPAGEFYFDPYNQQSFSGAGIDSNPLPVPPPQQYITGDGFQGQMEPMPMHQFVIVPTPNYYNGFQEIQVDMYHREVQSFYGQPPILFQDPYYPVHGMIQDHIRNPREQRKQCKY